MTILGVGIPWQYAESDPTYYSRARKQLEFIRFLNWKWDQLGEYGYWPQHWRNWEDSKTAEFVTKLKAYGNPVSLWGNEPDQVGQKNTGTPAQFLNLVKKGPVLSGGMWAMPGVLWGDSGRTWLEGYLALSGRILPTYWHIHIYGASTIAQWDAQYDHAQSWFAARSVSRALVITETNSASPNRADREALMHHLATRPGVRAFWYATTDPFLSMKPNDLLYHTTSGGPYRTTLGTYYKNLP